MVNKKTFILLCIMLTIQSRSAQAVIIEPLDSGMPNITANINSTSIPNDDPLATCTSLLNAEQRVGSAMSNELAITTVFLGVIAVNHLYNIMRPGRGRSSHYTVVGAACLGYIMYILHTQLGLDSYNSANTITPWILTGGALIVFLTSLVRGVQHCRFIRREHNNNNNNLEANLLNIDRVDEENIAQVERAEAIANARVQELRQQLNHLEQTINNHDEDITRRLLQSLAQKRLQLDEIPNSICIICEEGDTRNNLLGIIPCGAGTLHTQRIHQSCLEQQQNRPLTCAACSHVLFSTAIIPMNS